MKNQNALLVAAFAAALLQSCAPTKNVSIEGAFQPGQQFTYRMTENVDALTEAVEDPMPIPANHNIQHKETDYHYTVKAIRPDHSFDMEMVISRIYQKETTAEGDSEFDTDRPDPDSMSAKAHGQAMAFRVLIGHPFKMTLSPSGQVLSLHGMDDAWDEIEKKFRKESPLASNMLKNMKSQFGDETMKEGQNVLWAYQPGKKVRVGQKWKRPYSYDPLGLAGQTIYTLQEHSEKNARISFVTTLVSDKNKPGEIDMGVVKIRYKLSGSGTGTILTDQPFAMPRRMEQSSVMSGPMEVKTAYTGWITVPIKMTLSSVFERVD